jgi:hypothetical protein
VDASAAHLDAQQWCRVLGAAASNRDKLMLEPKLLSLPLTRRYVCESGRSDRIGRPPSPVPDEVESDASADLHTDDGEGACEHSSDSGATVDSEELGELDMLALKREWLGRGATKRKQQTLAIPVIRSSSSSSKPTSQAQAEHRKPKRTRIGFA